MKPIIKAGTRILRPSEYEKFITVLTLPMKTNFNALLYTGLRYVEAQRLQQHSDWFDGEFIHLPKEAQKKTKRKQLERWIRLNSLGKNILPYFFATKKLPNYKCWDVNVKRWADKSGIGVEGMCVKTTRKTWESWLTFYYPVNFQIICLSQGHNFITSMQHYINLPFTSGDKEEIKKYVEGWV